MLLKPLYLYANAVSEKYEKNIHLGVIHCIECGCCSYVCPSKLPLIDFIKQGKQKVLGLSESL
jgi:electron transport complex protein RnfC